MTYSGLILHSSKEILTVGGWVSNNIYPRLVWLEREVSIETTIADCLQRLRKRT
jgi:hypothetical protein